MTAEKAKKFENSQTEILDVEPPKIEMTVLPNVTIHQPKEDEDDLRPY